MAKVELEDIRKVDVKRRFVDRDVPIVVDLANVF